MVDNSDIKTGVSLLSSASQTKSTAFTLEEREKHNLRGLLPARVGNMETQIERVIANLRRQSSAIDKYIFLSALCERNERLFYRLVIDNIQEVFPLIYTPTVGAVCQDFAHLFRWERGFYISTHDQGSIRQMLDNWPHKNVKIIVVTDGERILGLGDLGANGMGIPIGKLSLYTACAGFHPHECLPIMLDVGTQNTILRDDPLYLGLSEPRLTGDEYFSFMDEVVTSVQDAYPEALIQFEDFSASNAYALLQRYHNKTLCFNDDIQGTAAVVLAGIIASSRITNTPLKDMKFLFLGAGTAATGIGEMIVDALVEEGGLTRKEAYQRLWFYNSKGLVSSSRTDLSSYVLPFAQNIEQMSFLDAIQYHKPDVLIGATGRANTFNQEMINLLSAVKKKPVIFALSNPTSCAECTAEDAYQWSQGRGVFASGSPFPDVIYKERHFRPGQSNNVYIFPGLGLGSIYAKSNRILSSTFLVAARTLASLVSDEDLALGSLYPNIDLIRDVTVKIAVAVAQHAKERGIAGHFIGEDIEQDVINSMYDPRY